jgi:hypothetical protein
MSYWLNTTVTPAAGMLTLPRHTLVLSGVDYNVTVYVNDKVVGTHVGPYITARIPLQQGVLLPGANSIAILFHPPQLELLSAWLGPGNGGQNVMWDYLDAWKSMVGIGCVAQPPFVCSDSAPPCSDVLVLI